MKNVLCLLSLIIAIPAFAATSKQVSLIKKDKEVVALIKAFEANRHEKCNPITDENVTLRADGYAKVIVSCNEYDKNGNPEANVYSITIKGQLYDILFDLQSLKIQGQE